MKKVYICIATAQNTINALPFYLSGFEFVTYFQVRIISSRKAREAEWNTHFEKFVNNNLDTLSVLKDEDELNTAGKVKDYLETHLATFDKLVINIGGGTKAMTLNILLAVNSLDEEQKLKYTLIYPNIELKRFDFFSFNPAFDLLHEPMQVHVPLKDILTCYGEEKSDIIVSKATKKTYDTDFDAESRQYLYAVVDSAKNVFDNYFSTKEDKDAISKDVAKVFGKFATDQKSDILSKWNVSNLPKMHPDFLSKFFKKDDFKIYLDYGVPSASNAKLSLNGGEEKVDLETFKTNFEGYNCGDLFEIIAQNRVTDYLTSKNSKHKCEITYNLEPKFNAIQGNDSELDIVLNNYNGDLLIFEVKTRIMSKKDFEAMLLKVQRYSGLYNQTYVLIPYFWNDFSDSYDDERLKISNNEYLQRLRNLPFDLQDNGIKFCVLGDTDVTYPLYKQGNEVSKSKIKGTAELKSVDIISYKTIIDNYINKYTK